MTASTDPCIYAERPGESGAPLLFVFHGTGGDEHQFLDVAPQLLSGAHVIAPRGDVSEGGALRYFRRTGEGVYDMADLARATDKMAAFIAGHRSALAPAWVGALGYSNGANILASVLFSAPELVDRAALLHPLIPFVPPPQTGLAGRRVLITAGRRDPICPPTSTETLTAWFAEQGTAVDVRWHDGGHELRSTEFAAAQDLFAD